MLVSKQDYMMKFQFCIFFCLKFSRTSFCLFAFLSFLTILPFVGIMVFNDCQALCLVTCPCLPSPCLSGLDFVWFCSICCLCFIYCVGIFCNQLLSVENFIYCFRRVLNLTFWNTKSLKYFLKILNIVSVFSTLY